MNTATGYIKQVFDFFKQLNEPTDAKGGSTRFAPVGIVRPEIEAILTDADGKCDCRQALILNQMMFKTMSSEGRLIWMPSGSKLKDECKLQKLDIRTFRERLKELVAMGYLEPGKPEPGSWDRSTRYRVCFDVVLKRLAEVGYATEANTIENQINLSGASNPVKSHDTKMYHREDNNVSWKEQKRIKQETKMPLDLKSKRSGSEIKEEQQATAAAASVKADAPESLASLLPHMNVPLPAQVTDPEPSPRSAAPLPESDSTELSLEREAVVQQLLEQGLTVRKARELSEKYPLAKIREEIAALPYRNATRSASGLLIEAIIDTKGKYSLPTAYVAEKQKRQAAPVESAAPAPDLWPQLRKRLQEAKAIIDAEGRRWRRLSINEGQRAVRLIPEGVPERMVDQIQTFTMKRLALCSFDLGTGGIA